jgi:lipopolysaccharide export system permease protein
VILDKLKLTIISRHLFLSFLAPFIIGQLFFSVVILLFSMRDIIQAVIEKSIGISLLFKLLVYSMGWTFGMTIPMSALLAVILTVGTLNSDQEIIVMRAGGMHYFRIFRPYLVFGIAATVILLWYQMNIVPYCMKMVTITGNKIADYNPTAFIEPGQFTLLDKQKDLSRNIYVDQIEDDKINKRSILKDIQIRKVEKRESEYRLTETVFASWGEKIVKTMPDGSISRALRLYDGFVYILGDKNDEFEKLNFNENGYMDINIKENITDLEREYRPGIIEYSVSELKESIAEYAPKNVLDKKERKQFKKLQTEYYKRTALPFATLFFMLAGFPLGIVNKRSGKGVGFGQAIIIIFIYFSLYLSSDAMALQVRFFSPLSASWLGNFIIFSSGLVLYIFKTTEIMWKINKIED